MSKQPVQICEGQFPHGCGQKVQERPIKLDAFLVRILREVARHYPASVQTKDVADSLASKAAYSVISKLKYFDLIRQGGPRPGVTVRGWWQVTRFGLWFLQGLHEVPSKVWVYGDEVVKTEKATGIEGITGYEPVSHDTVVAEWRPHHLEERA